MICETVETFKVMLFKNGMVLKYLASRDPEIIRN